MLFHLETPFAVSKNNMNVEIIFCRGNLIDCTNIRRTKLGIEKKIVLPLGIYI